MPAAKYALKLPNERMRFKQALQTLNGVEWTEKPEQYCDYRLDGTGPTGWIRAKQFTNGTLYLEASSEPGLELMQALISQAPIAPKQASLLPKKEKPSGIIEVQGAYIGTDESGKGDYFGPLVIAGVLVDEKTSPILAELGVMDSKKLKEKQIEELKQQIVEVVGAKAVVTVEIGPAKYNELYAKFKSGGKNLNHLLAWAHATAIENLLTRFPDCTQAIADQFGSEHYILSQLKDKGKQIKLHQTPRAEANVGVAAASIVARHHFTGKMRQLSSRCGVDLPFGASNLVKAQAKRFIQLHGKERLGEVAKLHFKTTEEL